MKRYIKMPCAGCIRRQARIDAAKAKYKAKVRSYLNQRRISNGKIRQKLKADNP
jgi:hypothetical protein